MAISLSLGRFVVRKQTIGRFYWDDCTHGFAAIVLIVFSVICSKLYPLIQEIGLYAAHEGPKPSSAALERFIRFEFAAILLFYVVIYTVKATFLLFYRQLFGVNRMFTRYWWGVTIYTVVCFLASFLTAFWTCETPGQLFALCKFTETMEEIC